jgi:hypothetical protein
MNVMLSSMKITDEFYSNLYDGEVQNRISSLGKTETTSIDNEELFRRFQEFLLWKKNHPK